jgi:thiamine-monophosphate kinase
MTLPAEFQLIGRHFLPLADVPEALGLADDAAVLRLPAERELVIAADAMVAGVHFLADDPSDTVGRKLLRVNLSDLAAMGATPLGFLLTVALPKGYDQAWLRGFALGLNEDRRGFACPLLGGDTVSTPGPVTLSLTILGTVAPGQALRRTGARAGEIVWVSGSIGDGALGLLALTGKLAGLEARHRGYLAERYRLPEPRLALGARLHGIATACLDVSDGLAQDLAHLARAAGAAGVIMAEAVPLSPAAAAAVRATAALRALTVTGGDDYELLFTAPQDATAQVRDAALAAGVSVTAIGRLEAGEPGEVRLLDAAGTPIPLRSQGWSHF